MSLVQLPVGFGMSTYGNGQKKEARIQKGFSDAKLFARPTWSGIAMNEYGILKESAKMLFMS